MENLTLFTTGDFVEDSSEFVWKICHLSSIQESVALIEAQKLDLNMGSIIKSKWQIGCRFFPDNGFGINFKLARKNVRQKIIIKFFVEDSKTMEPWVANSRRQMEPTSVAVGQEILIRFPWTMKTQQSNWDQYVDPEGSPKSANGNSEGQRFMEKSIHALQRDFTKLLNDTRSADITIICSDNIELSAHKLILSARNPVFASMLSCDMSECKSTVVNVEDVSSAIMEILLNYVYTGSLLPTWCHPENIVEFTYAAGKYNLKEVLEMLDNKLGENGGPTSNLLLLSLANKLGLKTAEKQLMNRVVAMVNATQSAEEVVTLFDSGN